MDTNGALGRLTALARRDAIPLARGALGRAHAGLDRLVARLAGPDFDERLRRLPVQLGPGGVDPYGLDPEWAKYAVAVAALVHRYYFRTEVKGIENVPAGRVLLIANHSGQVPLDGVVIGAAMFQDAEPPRIVRAMVEKWAQTLPFVSQLFVRCGSVVGVQENARGLLAQGEALLVFPEGARGISKPFSERYRLTEFGLGFLRLALETDTPIVPIAVVGAEEQYVSVANVESLARLFRMPGFPIIPQIFVPGLQAPLPTRYRLYFGEPLRFAGDPDDDDAVVEEKVWVVKATIQSMINRGLKERRAIFW